MSGILKLFHGFYAAFRAEMLEFSKWSFIKKTLNNGSRYTLLIEIKEINGITSYEYYAKGRTNKEEINVVFSEIIQEIEENLEESQIKSEIEELTKTIYN